MCHRKNSASEASFATRRRQKKFQGQHRDLHKLRWENAYMRSFSWYNGTVAQQLFGALGHSIFEKNFVFLFKESAIKPTPLLHANFQMSWRTECNRSNRRRPKCSSGPPVHNIHQWYGWICIYAGSDKSAAHGRIWAFQKAYRQLHNYE